MHSAPYFTALGLLAILNSLRVVKYRFQYKVSLGDGGHDLLMRAIRVHANFMEYVPLGLVLLAVLEFVSAPVIFLHLTGATLFMGRVFHAIGLLGKGSSPARITGMVLTWISILLGSIGVALFSILQLRG